MLPSLLPDGGTPSSICESNWGRAEVHAELASTATQNPHPPPSTPQIVGFPFCFSISEILITAVVECDYVTIILPPRLETTLQLARRKKSRLCPLENLSAWPARTDGVLRLLPESIMHVCLNFSFQILLRHVIGPTSDSVRPTLLYGRVIRQQSQEEESLICIFLYFPCLESS